MSGCISHSHANDTFHKRIPEVKRNEIVHLLSKYIRKEEIVKYYCQPNPLDRQKIISYDDVRRIDSWQKKIIRSGKEQFDQIQGALRCKSIVGFNLDRQGFDTAKEKFDKDVQEKWIPSSGDLIVHISEDQRRWFRENPALLIAAQMLQK